MTIGAILSGRLFHTETGHVHLLSRPLFYLSVMRCLTLGTESAEADGRTAYLTTHKYIGTGRDLQTALLDHAPDSLLCHPGLARHLCHRSASQRDRRAGEKEDEHDRFQYGKAYWRGWRKAFQERRLEEAGSNKVRQAAG